MQGIENIDENVNPQAVDTHIGQRIKTRRILTGMTQQQLGNAMGLTFQQVQKYERGVNHMAINRLLDICRALGVSLDYFFEGIPGMARGKKRPGFADNDQTPFENENIMMQKDVLELTRAYSQIRDLKLKKQLLEMARAMAASDKK